jgi:hypothetical protein
MRPLARSAVQYQKSRLIAGGRRNLRDQPGRQCEIKLGGAHRAKVWRL